MTATTDYTALTSVPNQQAGVSAILADDWNTYVKSTFSSLSAGHIVTTTSDRNAFAAPEGVMVYDTGDQKLYIRSNAGSWLQIPKFNDSFTGSSITLTGNLTAVNGIFSGTLSATSSVSGRTAVFTGTAAGDVVATFKNASSPTANLVEFKNSAGTTMSSVSSAGTFVGAVTGNVTGNLTGIATRLGQNGALTTGMTFNWSGQSGQPTWLWGSNDGTNHYVWNPSNFSVNYAGSAGSAPANGGTSTYVLRPGGGYISGDSTYGYQVGANGTGVGNMSGTIRAGQFVTTSARKYKENIVPYTHDIETLLALVPVKYNYKEQDKTRYGFIADDALTAGVDEFVDVINGEVESFDYIGFTTGLLAICQDQQKRIDDLEARLSALEG